jgi:hypothetical protein
MVGSDKDKFKDLAGETKLPEDRQDSCAEDYSDALYAWDLLLKPHLRSPDQPKTKIDVVYGEARGGLEPGARAAQSILFLETVAQNLTDWKCKAAASPTPVGSFQPISLRCVTN